MVRRLGIIIAVGLGLASCGLIAEDTPAVDGGDGGVLDVVVIEASAPDSGTIDAPIEDVSSDATGTDYVPCGACTSKVVASAVDARGLAADQTRVYWANPPQNGWYSVSKCDIASCSPATVLGYGHRNLEVVGTNLFDWDSLGATVCTTTDCNDGGRPLFATSNDGLQGFGTAGGDAFWSSQIGSIERCDPETYCTSSTTFIANQPSPRDVVVDDASVFWINGGSDGGIIACSTDACDGGGVELAGHQTSTSSLAQSSSTIFWILQGSSILACSKAGCGGKPTVLATFVESVTSLAVTESAAYFILADPSKRWRIVKLVLDHSQPPTAITQDDPAQTQANIALNAQDVFWVSSSGDLTMTAQ
jgi:hypothetical protein